jgi:hypothetical protein
MLPRVVANGAISCKPKLCLQTTRRDMRSNLPNFHFSRFFMLHSPNLLPQLNAERDKTANRPNGQPTKRDKRQPAEWDKTAKPPNRIKRTTSRTESRGEPAKWDKRSNAGRHV